MEGVILHPDALGELRDAVAYYETVRDGLGRQLLAAAEEAAELLRAHPESGRVIRPPYRRFLLKRFPYGVIYRQTPDGVYIIAFMHLKRRPDYWEKRQPHN